MNKSELFKAAHKLAKSVIQAGDNYAVTFGACIKNVLKDLRVTAKAVTKGVLKNWSVKNIKRAYVAKFDRDHGSNSLVVKLNEAGINASAAYFDYTTAEICFTNLYTGTFGGNKFEGTNEQVYKKALQITKTFLNAEMKK